jgi:hypothetical protein
MPIAVIRYSHRPPFYVGGLENTTPTQLLDEMEAHYGHREWDIIPLISLLTFVDERGWRLVGHAVGPGPGSGPGPGLGPETYETYVLRHD